MAPRASKYGPAVIGAEAFKQEDAIRRNPVQRFGPGVLGTAPPATKARPKKAAPVLEPEPTEPTEPAQDPADDAAAELATGADKLRLSLAARKAERDQAAEEKKHTVEGQSIAEATAALEANPALVDAYLAAERLRKPAPRKGVLHALIQAEKAAPTPRLELVAELEQMLAPAS